jgi:transposase-like protein
MKRSNRKRHRPEEVVTKLRQADEALAEGAPITEVARSLGVSEVILHRWRAEHGAVDLDAVRRMKWTSTRFVDTPDRQDCPLPEGACFMSTMRAYTREFRESAVGLVLSEGLSICKAADDLGMPYL